MEASKDATGGTCYGISLTWLHFDADIKMFPAIRRPRKQASDQVQLNPVVKVVLRGPKIE